MSAKKKLKDIKAEVTLRELRAEGVAVAGCWSEDGFFRSKAQLFMAERLDSIEDLLRTLIEAVTARKPHRKPSAWQRFFAAGMKAGKTPKQIGAEWRERKP